MALQAAVFKGVKQAAELAGLRRQRFLLHAAERPTAARRQANLPDERRRGRA